MDPLVKTALLQTVGFLIFTSVSPWLFVLVEYSEEDTLKTKYQLLRSLYQSVTSKCNITLEEFNNFSRVAHEALSEPKRKWTYFVALEFVFQAITTIGYGNITPHTPEGQTLCIFVSLIGIPISILTLKSVGEVIVKMINVVVTKLERKILNRRLEPKQLQTKSAVILFLLMVILMIASGWLFKHLEDWTFVEGVYFWFITFTTIGFGDYLPSPQQSETIKEFSANNKNNSINRESTDEAINVEDKLTAENIFLRIAYLLLYTLSLCIVSSVINSIVAAIEERKHYLRPKECVPRKTQDHMKNEQSNTQEQRHPGKTYLGMENFGFQKGNDNSLSVIEIE